MSNDFSYCPSCGSTKISNVNNRKWICPDCNFDLYNNVAAAVGVIFYNEDRTILFETRAKEPRKGYLALPGGFIDPDESAEEAAKRECMEEIGVIPSKLEYLCSFPNTYEYKGITYKTCDLFFTAKLEENTFTLEKSEVASMIRKKVENESDIETLPLAFDSARRTLKLWLSKISEKK